MATIGRICSVILQSPPSSVTYNSPLSTEEVIHSTLSSTASDFLRARSALIAYDAGTWPSVAMTTGRSQSYVPDGGLTSAVNMRENDADEEMIREAGEVRVREERRKRQLKTKHEKYGRDKYSRYRDA